VCGTVVLAMRMSRATRAAGTCPRVGHHELTARALAAAQYTFRNEHVFFANNFKTINDEYQAALDAGVDGLFTDYTEGAYSVCTASSPRFGRVAHQEVQALQSV